jgi:peptidoglycan/xylan/chitin deacetylase (PgdA/CDA1 family)
MGGEMRNQVRGEVRRAAKTAAAAALHYSGLRKALAAYQRLQAGGRRILITSYHRVVGDFTGELQRSIPGLLISQETFRKHLEEAHAAGYELASLEDALDVMAGRRKAKKDLCVVTFDDGYRDVYRYAYPVMKAMGVPSTIYLPALYVGTDRRFDHDRLFHLVRLMLREKVQPLYEGLPPSAASLIGPVLAGQKTLSASLDDFIGEHPGATLRAIIDGLEKQLGARGADALPEQGDVMGWDEVREMAKNGVSFGAHTLHHTVLTLETPGQVEKELAEGKAICERELGQPVRDFAYCNGWYSDEVIATLKRLGYRSAVTTEDFTNRIGGDPFTLKRKVLWENFSLGMGGDYSSCLTGCQLDDVFGVLGVNHPVPGYRPQGVPASQAATQAAREGGQVQL